ncbi:PREDICTED: uncharacterized protein LOC105455283 [Wasmannia auropunctata]|uniref:uncharacterized protein LOC105455283 n=1 Tax=Wasmannia auropunctata TaxID=64793 RepID=UPI0005EF81E3|nr:PREDICTED: uncharacterized protein LOC105455283 [Wasmannia auropunctata]
MSTRTTMTTTMFKPRFSSTLLTNGSGELAGENAETRKAAPARFWARIRLDEWTFSLSLFAFSLAIVLGKLYVNYGKPLSWQIGDRYSLPSVATFTQMYETIPSMSILPKFDMKQLPADSGRLLSASNQYAADMLITIYGRYGWLLKAAMSGLVITGFTWFILYKDSSIPGVNPPSPFSPSRQRIHGSSRIQLNYLVGVLNGVLFFVYMCL